MATLTDSASRRRLDAEALRELVRDTLAEAARQGASGAEANVSMSQGMVVTVRLGEVETVEHTRDQGLGVTVYFGQQSGSASTSDLGLAAMRDTVRAAASIAKHTAADEFAGLPDRDALARDVPELDLFHPWDVDTESAIALAQECESAARDADARIRNSEGASVSTHRGVEVFGNSLQFLGAVASTRHSLSCAVIAQNERGMQRDYWYTSARDARDLEAAGAVGRRAAQRSVERLDARKLSTRRTPVIFEAPIASSLLSHFVAAIRGTSLYRQASFLLDHLGKPVFPAGTRISEHPHLKKAPGSAPFDNEGCATRERDLVRDGVLQGYVLDSYSGRKLGMPTTGNAGGVRNLRIEPGEHDLSGLLRQMHTGLLVTELIGFGVNGVTGDYSRGASGFWVENGEIQYPVEEITIAGNLKDMYRELLAVGKDVDRRGNIQTGSLLIDGLTLAGN